MVAQTISVEDYLKALDALGGRSGYVRGARVAERLAVSRPSASAMLNRLTAGGLVAAKKGKGFRLTSDGCKHSLRIIRKHRILELYLLKVLKLDWEVVHQEAERLEHALSDRVEAAMAEALGHPQWDPEGRPIPTADLELPIRDLAPLHGSAEGREFIVRELRDEAPERLRRFRDRGLVPGARVAIESYDEIDDLYTLRIGRKRAIVGSEGLEGVYVEEATKEMPDARA
jgi:DtxR family Mn-dependent transcriptional regulator